MAVDTYEAPVDETQPDDSSEIEPGTLGPYDYSTEDNVELTEPAEKWLVSQVRTCMLRDQASRRFEVEQAWEARLFNRGYQYLLPRAGGGWAIPGNSTGFGAANQQAWASLYETNIYGAHGDIVIAALTRDTPTCRFEPANPDFAPDTTAASEANKFKDIYARNNDLKKLYTQAASYGWTDGRILFHTRYVIDGQRYGYEDEADESPVVPEDEEQPNSPPDVEGQEAQDETSTANYSVSTGKRKPRGCEQTDVFGKLETKLPNVQNMADMHYISICYEVDESIGKGMFPQIADKIHPGGSGEGSSELDRIARMNVQSALASQYVSGENLNKDVTIRKTWLRPSNWLVAPKDDGVRDELLKSFPDGCVVVEAGSTFCYARPEIMEDHLHVMQMFPGSGQNRNALGTKCISVQKRLNTVLDLQFDYFINNVPQKWMDSEVFNVEALKTQPNYPGGIHGFQRQPGVPVEEMLFIEPVAAQNAAMPDFINWLFNECMQMLSAALPSLFGAQSNVDNPTVGASAMQRDQALARLSSPWGAFQSATACIYRQATAIAAKCRAERGENSIAQSVEGRKIVIEVSDLKGNVLVFPDVDANIPESPEQKRARIQQLMVEGVNNPMLEKLFSVAANQRSLKDGIGLRDLVFPEQAQADAQLGELEILLKAGPMPNPKIQQAKEQLLQHAKDAEAAGEIQQFEAMLPQAEAAMQQLPPLVSTVPIDIEVDDHDVHVAECQQWMISAEGRKFKNGDEKQQAVYANVRLHFMEHTQAAAQKKAQAKAENALPPKPPTINISSKDLPPKEAAEAARLAGMPDATPEDFGAAKAADAASKVMIHRESKVQ